MKITKFEIFHVKPRWMFLKVYTDEGITGYGEPIVEGRARTVAMAIRELEKTLVGKDPGAIIHHWQSMYRGTFYRGGPVLVSAISGIEQALWDIKGKRLGVPVYELLGGAVRNRIRMYGKGGAANTSALKAAGFTAIKIGMEGPARNIETLTFIERQVNHFASVRQAVGKDVDIAIDFHGRISPAMAKKLARELEPFHPMFIEEPCLPENTDALVDIARSTTVPIAAGERLYTRWGFRELLEKRALAVVQPDLCHCGGIFEGRLIAAMAETNYASVAPHNPLGPISLAACIQLDACIPNFLAQEHPTMEDRWDLGHGYLKTPFEIKEGYIDLPVGPGLGIELNDAMLTERVCDGDWDTPRLLFPDDGSVGDW
jgi:galactonate dehydratase